MYEQEIAALENEREEIENRDADEYTAEELARLDEIGIELHELIEAREAAQEEASEREYRAEWLEQQPTRYSQLGY